MHDVAEEASAREFPPDRVAYIASAVVEPQISAAACGYYVDVMVFWFPMRYHQPWYRRAFGRLGEQLRDAIEQCRAEEADSITRVSMEIFGRCLQDQVRHTPAASLIVEDGQIRFSLGEGALIEETITGRRGFHWKVFVMPLLHNA